MTYYKVTTIKVIEVPDDPIKYAALAAVLAEDAGEPEDEIIYMTDPRQLASAIACVNDAGDLTHLLRSTTETVEEGA
jgi:hypothetical protein